MDAKSSSAGTTTFAPGVFGHPRPQLERAWTCLNGLWDWALDIDATLTHPDDVKYDRQILVPYAPETSASTVGFVGFFKASWYRLHIARPKLKRGERAILHFGAVDYEATVWVNGQFVVRHEGGYTPFSCDITDYLRRAGKQRIEVRAYDDPLDMEMPRGKQDWRQDPHAIWYPRTSGIWQTVWMEIIPAVAIDKLRWNSSVADWAIDMHAILRGANRDAYKLTVTLNFRGEQLASDTYSVRNGQVERRIALPDPGIGDERNQFTWHPDHPHLFEVVLELKNKRGKVIDRVRSYTALRELGWDGERVTLNGDVIRMRLALDQGYWLETGLTAPSDEAQKRDVELAREAGFNGVRKHQKIEDPRYLYWADRLGLMVWQEMPSAYAFTKTSMRRVTTEWMAALERDFSHPCVVTLVPINESWMVPDLPVSEEQRNFVSALFLLTKAFDSTRPVVCNSGWEAVISADIITGHDYDANPKSFANRYLDRDETFVNLFKRGRPGGKLLVLNAKWEGKVLGIDEFGGIKFDIDKVEGEHSWGYSKVESSEEFLQRYAGLVGVLHGHPRISIWCWTQLFDTYQEKNGIYTMKRIAKAPIEKVRHISHTGQLPSAA
jgi:hypothetical protein